MIQDVYKKSVLKQLIQNMREKMSALKEDKVTNLSDAVEDAAEDAADDIVRPKGSAVPSVDGLRGEIGEEAEELLMSLLGGDSQEEAKRDRIPSIYDIVGGAITGDAGEPEVIKTTIVETGLPLKAKKRK